MKQVLAILLLLSTGTFISGCGGPKTVIYDQPSRVASEHYERVWVDPQIVFADSLVTVIQASRIDSIKLTSIPPEAEKVAEIGFHVVSEDCNVVVNLADSYGTVLRLLFARNLGRGYYKFTLNHPLSLEEVGPLRRYLLKADYCGTPLIEPFFTGR